MLQNLKFIVTNFVELFGFLRKKKNPFFVIVKFVKYHSPIQYTGVTPLILLWDQFVWVNYHNDYLLYEIM